MLLRITPGVSVGVAMVASLRAGQIARMAFPQLCDRKPSDSRRKEGRDRVRGVLPPGVAQHDRQATVVSVHLRATLSLNSEGLTGLVHRAPAWARVSRRGVDRVRGDVCSGDATGRREGSGVIRPGLS